MTTTTAPARVLCDLAPAPRAGTWTRGYDVTFTNYENEPFTCERITLALTGDGADSGGTAAFEVQEHTATAAWTVTAEDGGTRFTAVPGSGDGTLVSGESVGFALSLAGPAPSSLCVTTTVTGSAGGRPVTTGAEDHVLGPPPDDRIIHGLRAAPYHVGRGQTATLHWNDGGGTAPSYQMSWAVKGERMKHGLSEDGKNSRYRRNAATGDCSYLTNQMLEQTVFVLTAERAPKHDTQAVLVTVEQGDLRVGELTLNGTAKLIGSPQNLFPEKNPVVTPPGGCSWTTDPAPTSGLLLATLRTTTAKNPSGKATLRVTTASSAAPNTLSLPGDREGHLTAAVRDGDVVGISVGVENGGPTATLYATWFPFGCRTAEGNGRLGVKPRK
ncbi:hypothetical protein FGW37_31040 [Streptomyces rectiverticillatus]|uniref:hypothetical protein n=1 Tax=Streptomyces rectiverticillatus TaxID=173860 RepID=UPI0015C31C72|nr:hypothetical protein [Streptomyces rectiverticillatus]QLE75432.1 hypothetical protein FGW37_31040 [Streptomyces rectiverticillatus]